MSVETTANRISYAGNGVTTVFAFPYRFLDDGDLVVIVRNNTTGVETTKTITTHYTVAANGNVTMLSAPSASESLIIYNDPTKTQGLDLRENDSLPAESTEEALDRLTLISQRLGNRVDRSVRLSDGFSPTFDPTLPGDLDDAAGRIPLVNEDGDGFADAADWPDVDGVTAGMEASAAAAAASASAAATSASAAATSASAAATSASGAATSATNASTSASNASTSATAAAASALAAQNAAAANLWRDVVFLTSADSPRTILSSERNKLFACDTSGGAITLNLPQISGLDLAVPFAIGIKKTTADGNSITINRAGTDTIDGSTSKTISVAQGGTTLIPDTDPAPDRWTSADFGASAGNLTVDRFSGTGSQTAFTLSTDPGSENNTFVMINGVYQQKDTYSVSGTTLTFSSAPPSGTDNIEVVIGTLLSIGTPSDGTVTRAKLVAGAVAKVSVTASKTSTYTATSDDDVIPCNASGGAFTVNLPALASSLGMRLTVVKTDSSANAVTVDANSTETIGSTALTALLHTQGAAIVLVAQASGWIVEKFTGDYIEALATTLTNLPATTTWGDLTSLSIPAGDWDVTVNALSNRNTTSIAAFTNCGIGVSTTSGNSSTGLVEGVNLMIHQNGNGMDIVPMTIANYRVNITAATTHYLKMRGVYSANQPQIQGRISARRVKLN